MLKMLVKDIKEDLNKWVEKVNIAKMSLLTKWIYRFNTIPIKISARFLVDIDKLIVKCMWKATDSRVAKAVLTKNTVAGRFGIGRLEYVFTLQ